MDGILFILFDELVNNKIIFVFLVIYCLWLFGSEGFIGK